MTTLTVALAIKPAYFKGLPYGIFVTGALKLNLLMVNYKSSWVKNPSIDEFKNYLTQRLK